MRIHSLDNPPRREWPGLCSEEEYSCWASLSPKDIYLAQTPRETLPLCSSVAEFLAEPLGCTLPAKGTSTACEVGDWVWGGLLFDLCFPWVFWKCLQGAAGLTFQLVELFSTAAVTGGGAGIQGVQKFFCLVATPGLLSFPYISGQTAGATGCCCSLLVWKRVWLLKWTPFSSPLKQVMSADTCVSITSRQRSSLVVSWGTGRVPEAPFLLLGGEGSAAVISSALERISFRKLNFLGWGK